MVRIHSTATALAPHEYSQDELIAALLQRWGERYYNPGRIEQFQRNVLVGGRHLALPIEAYESLDGFGAHNDAWIRVATDMAEAAIQDLLARAGLAPDEISIVISTTVTGIAVPSLEARVMNRLEFSPATKRVPLFGLGCLAGCAGVNRLGDYLRGHPGEAGILLSVELCSLTLQREDLSVANIIASGLFGDGCAAVLMVGDEHPLAASAPLAWSHPRSVFFPQTERIMGWDVVDSGFKVVLSPEVPSLVKEELPSAVEGLLRDADLGADALDFYVAHPGGPKVLGAMQEALGLSQADLQASWDSLATYGNMSSTSVLFVLHELLKALPPPGQRGLMAAMGPAFCAELNLLERVG
ncbi:MAG: type III polyketide synthase [Myxococcales bacterium]|nr:type III polyketide synthase [Myxococcales bacterium]